MGGVGAVINHCSCKFIIILYSYTHTYILIHIRAYVHEYTTAPCTRSTKADQLTVDLARRVHQSPGRLIDEDCLVRRRRAACALPVKPVTGLCITVFRDSESRCRKENAGSRLRCALEAVRGSLQNIPTLGRHFVRDDIRDNKL